MTHEHQLTSQIPISLTSCQMAWAVQYSQWRCASSSALPADCNSSVTASSASLSLAFRVVALSSTSVRTQIHALDITGLIMMMYPVFKSIHSSTTFTTFNLRRVERKQASSPFLNGGGPIGEHGSYERSGLARSRHKHLGTAWHGNGRAPQQRHISYIIIPGTNVLARQLFTVPKGRAATSNYNRSGRSWRRRVAAKKNIMMRPNTIGTKHEPTSSLISIGPPKSR